MLESLLRSKAQVEDGQTVPMEPVMARLRESLARMEAKRAAKAKLQARKA